MLKTFCSSPWIKLVRKTNVSEVACRFGSIDKSSLNDIYYNWSWITIQLEFADSINFIFDISETVQVLSINAEHSSRIFEIDIFSIVREILGRKCSCLKIFFNMHIFTQSEVENLLKASQLFFLQYYTWLLDVSKFKQEGYFQGRFLFPTIQKASRKLRSWN